MMDAIAPEWNSTPKKELQDPFEFDLTGVMTTSKTSISIRNGQIPKSALANGFDYGRI
jgi:hypothetical protein